MVGLFVTDDAELHLADLAGLRQALYRLIAIGAMHPSGGGDQEVADILTALQQEDVLMARIPWYPAFRQVRRGLEGLATMPEAYRDELFKQIDDPPKSSGRNGARGSVYLMMGGLQAGELIGSLEGLYRKTGLEWDRDSGIAPDGAAVQLDFLRYLCGLEAMAWEAEDAGKANAFLDQEMAFLADHIGAWYIDHIDGVLAALDLPEAWVDLLVGTRDFLRGEMTLIPMVRMEDLTR